MIAQRMVQGILAALVFGTYTASGLQAVAESSTAQQLFVFIYAQGPAWKTGLPMREQALGPHGRYMKELRDAHKLFAAGPLTDSNGGLVIVKARDRDDAQDVMSHDPAIIGGIFTGKIEAWTPMFEAGQSPKDFLAGK